MRDTVSTGRSAATGGRRALLLLALLALLHAVLSTDSSDLPTPVAGRCLGHAAPAVSGPPERPCTSAVPVLTSSEGGGRHPGSGVRRRCEASACHLRHHVPTGAGGKAVSEAAAAEAVAAPGHSAAWTVVRAAAAASAPLVTVLRC
ncbi:hypothetical protein AB0C96_08550 [Streptomyces sp. NPDC048506]|uniref:hypothetical protein n=1 Tax=Streptomyces sp. NPDC048506 TaxID=3155028 RepID=UPI00342AEFA0